MSAQTRVDVPSVMQRTSEGLHGIADGCRNAELAAAMRDRAKEFDAAWAAVAELLGAAKPAADRLLRLCETRLRGAECAAARDDWRRLSDALANMGRAS